MKGKKGYRRGYPVALLVGFGDCQAVLWHVFSHVAKLHLKLDLRGKRTDDNALYNFHESIVDALKPQLEEGIRSVVVVAPAKTTYSTDFLDHVRKHHAYLTQQKRLNNVSFVELVGSADQPHSVAELVKTKEFREIVTESNSGEADNLINELEKSLSRAASGSVVLYSLKEIEDSIYNSDGSDESATEYLLLTDRYLADSKDKSRVHRLLQISKNKKVKTRVISAETPAGKRITQMGGIVFFPTQTE